MLYWSLKTIRRLENFEIFAINFHAFKRAVQINFLLAPRKNAIVKKSMVLHPKNKNRT